jgi:hypothetical protein
VEFTVSFDKKLTIENFGWFWKQLFMGCKESTPPLTTLMPLLCLTFPMISKNHEWKLNCHYTYRSCIHCFVATAATGKSFSRNTNFLVQKEAGVIHWRKKQQRKLSKILCFWWRGNSSKFESLKGIVIHISRSILGRLHFGLASSSLHTVIKWNWKTHQ